MGPVSFYRTGTWHRLRPVLSLRGSSGFRISRGPVRRVRFFKGQAGCESQRKHHRLPLRLMSLLRIAQFER